ncbi:uncharacterized protein YodC (DUF2158 family) [Paraburkholderia sp. MM6662-R1]
MDRTLSVGDMVRLIGSEKVMVVTDQMDDQGAPYCRCEWHDVSGQPCERWYAAAALVRVE